MGTTMDTTLTVLGEGEEGRQLNPEIWRPIVETTPSDSHTDTRREARGQPTVEECSRTRPVSGAYGTVLPHAVRGTLDYRRCTKSTCFVRKLEFAVDETARRGW